GRGEAFARFRETPVPILQEIGVDGAGGLPGAHLRLSLSRATSRPRSGSRIQSWRWLVRPLPRLEGGAAGTVFLSFASGVLQAGAGVGVDELAGLDSLEAVSREEPGVRCFQQRSSNSPCPEVDVAPPLVADRVLDRDVGDLDPAAGREHAAELGED